MLALHWWVYLIVATVVFGSMTAACWFHDRGSKLVYPCLGYVAHGTGGRIAYCGQRDGHTGPCGLGPVLLAVSRAPELGD